jgi:hypothetical protein
LFTAQLEEFPTSAHVELASSRPSNAWLRGFDWIHENTPQNAYFALNPRYLELPGEDFHGFRALAERSMLADDIDDRVVATIEPGVAAEWLEQDTALKSWKDFTGADLRSLKNRFGVDWVVLESGHPALTDAMVCPYRNESMAICRLP